MLGITLCALVLRVDAFTRLPVPVDLPTRSAHIGARSLPKKPESNIRHESVALRASSALGDLRKMEAELSTADAEQEERSRALAARSATEKSRQEKQQFIKFIGGRAAEAKGFLENDRATYCIKWVKKGNKFVAEDWFITTERMKALRNWRAANGKNDDKSFASESSKLTFNANGKGPVATAFREKTEQVVTDMSTIRRAELATEFGLRSINFVPLKDGSGVLEYGTPSSEVEKEQFMAELGATYSLHWVRRGNVFVVDKDFTTEARKKAMRQVRRDDKLFATESRKYQLSAEGTGPVATACRTGQEQVVTDWKSMKRAALCQEFGVKKITFVPLPDGSVIEYGSPSQEETELLKLLSLLIQELAEAPSFVKFLKVLRETACVLRNVVVIEGPTEIMAGIRKSTSALLEGTMALEKKLQQESLQGRCKSSRRLFAFRVAITPVSFVVTKLTFMKDSFDSWMRDQSDKRRMKQQRRAEAKGIVAPA